MMPFVLTIRTSDRTPKQNYLGKTVRSFLDAGGDASALHLFPTTPDVGWLATELEGLPDIRVHVPDRMYSPNANGIRQIAVLDVCGASWIGMLEDDLQFCADPVGSMIRWLSVHAVPDVRVYRFCALPGTPVRPQSDHAVLTPLREQRGSQAIAMRAEDARLLREWALAHPKDWRPDGAPFQDRPDRGFDKLVGYWALQQWPAQSFGLLSQPMLVKHVGRQSVLHTHGVSDDRKFAGAAWRYVPETAVH